MKKMTKIKEVITEREKTKEIRDRDGQTQFKDRGLNKRSFFC